MSKLEQLKDKAKGLEAKEPKKAVEYWLEALKTQESDGEPNPDLSIYNRIGDLYIKLKDPGQAADYYDQAVDKYAELGFHNNAIAMCNKVLRNAPARQATYLKLAKLYAAKGFMTEAQQNFVQYAERMQKAGKIESAFSALKEFTDISPESERLREILTEHLKMYGGDPGAGRRSAAKINVPTATGPGGEDISKSGKRKTSSLVFLDLGEPSPAKGVPAAKPGARVAPPPPVAKPAAKAAPPPPVVEEEEISDLEIPGSIEIETTNLVEDETETVESGGLLEGLETTSSDFGQVRASSPRTPSIREELNPADLELEPMSELEPTVSQEADEAEPDGLEDAELVLEGDVDLEPEPPRAPPPPKVQPPKAQPPKAPPKLAPLKMPAAKPPEPAKVKPV
ncbi:MAG TPA: hypothetical protein VK467_04660, partial [Gemmatimonadales bacterium]|nr:hypothetical protein [Gemmatimonadales bacterium]